MGAAGGARPHHRGGGGGLARGRVLPLTPAVGEAIADYHQLLASADARAEAERLADGFRRAGVLFDGAPMATCLRPHLVGREEWEAFRAAAARLVALAERVARRAFDGDAGRLCAWLGMPEPHARWIALDPGPPDVLLSRADGFLTAAGPRFIELNSDAPAGFGYGDRMAQAFRELPTFREFAGRHAVAYHGSAPALVAAVRGSWRGREGREPMVAIVDWREVKTRPDQQILGEAFAAAGVPCFLADPRDLDWRGGRLVGEGGPVDVVYRRALLGELAAREEDARALLAAYAAGGAVFVNSFRCQLSEDKALLALLTDEEHAVLLSDEERVFVAAVVPWTRKVEERRTWKAGGSVDLVPWVMAHREELVLKPGHEYGGRSVLVGGETAPSEWEAAVRAAVGGPWVVQERVPVPREPFPACGAGGSLEIEDLNVTAGPFYVAGAQVGGVTRVSRAAVVNVSAGGGSVPTFVLG